MAKTVDTEGRVIVLTTTKEHAELKRDQILAYGKDDTIGAAKARCTRRSKVRIAYLSNEISVGGHAELRQVDVNSASRPTLSGHVA